MPKPAVLTGIREVVPRIQVLVGGEPLFLLHGGGSAFDKRKLRGWDGFGAGTYYRAETPPFTFRVIVEIMRLGPCPRQSMIRTTAVLLIDQLHRLLRNVGKRHLHDEQIMDDAGYCAGVTCRLRIQKIWCSWLVGRFTSTEQKTFRSRALARHARQSDENFAESRGPALRLELELLDRAVEKFYPLFGGSGGGPHCRHARSWRMIRCGVRRFQRTANI